MRKRNKQKISSVINNNVFMLRKIAKYAPDYFIGMIAEGIIWGLINSSMAYFSYNLLNTVSVGKDFPYAAKLIGIMAVFYLIVYAFDRWYWAIHNPIMQQKLHFKMHEELFVKSHSLDLACFDDPEFYNDFVWAMKESDSRAIQVIEDTGKLINRIVSSFSLFGLILTVNPIIALILLMSSCIQIICNSVGNKVNFRHSKEENPIWRKKNYINRVYHLADYAKELRISSADDLLMADYDDNTNKQKDISVKYGKKYFLLYGIGCNLAGELTFFVTLLYMIFLLKDGSLEVGGFAAAIGVVWRIRWLLTDLIERLTKYPQHSLYIEKYLEFLRFTPQIKDGSIDIPPFESLEFKNVSFSYDFASHPKYQFHEEDHEVNQNGNQKTHALKNVNFKISAGDKIAVVGYNGAGKTTLIKLIMRLYDPTEGEILYNGVNIKKYDPQVYRKHIGTVFQDYKIFATSIAQNVMSGSYSEDYDRQNVIDALNVSDFTQKLSTLEKGIDTQLTREFDDEGTNLSGGESQKIAIARVFANEYTIIIMDEPSSALDPMAEYNLNKSILRHTNDKTVVFISHRLSTTRIADKIYMFSDGRLLEEGSHAELLEADGKYAEMFRLQSEKYEDGRVVCS